MQNVRSRQRRGICRNQHFFISDASNPVIVCFGEFAVRVGLIASPFISVPPPGYGGTELFIANLAEALKGLGVDVVVYTNGESRVHAEVRWLYARHEWPLSSELAGATKEVDHLSWAIDDADKICDVIHVNSALAVPLSRLARKPVVCTLHHPYEDSLAALYEQHERVNYVSISAHQASCHANLQMQVIHHGLTTQRYRFSEKKQPYLCFLGRICPIKGTHHAIEIAKRAGMPLKIAGEVQPIFRKYFETEIRPHVDGRNVEFVGEADLALKNELLSNATAMLFPIGWDEPFGLAMVEAMACGTPVIAFPGGAVEEIVKDGISGRVCRNVSEAAETLKQEQFEPRVVRQWVEQNFSAEVMAWRYYQLYAELLEQTAPDPNLDTEETAA
jgi:glycosyltransferase involved in cell wall biosynthesis